MEKFGKFIDDIREEINWINVSFEQEPYGESMTIMVPSSTRKYIVYTEKIGKIEYCTKMYDELLKMTLEILNRFSKKVDNEQS